MKEACKKCGIALRLLTIDSPSEEFDALLACADACIGQAEALDQESELLGTLRAIRRKVLVLLDDKEYRDRSRRKVSV